MDNSTIDVVETIIESIILNSSLKWDSQIECLSKKLSSAWFALGLVSKSSTCQHQEQTIMLFSNLRYALPFWGCHSVWAYVNVGYSLGLDSITCSGLL